MHKKILSVFLLIFSVLSIRSAMIHKKRLHFARSYPIDKSYLKCREKKSTGIFHPFFPQEIGHNILKFIATNSGAENLEEAAQIFRALLYTNKFINQYISDSAQTFQYIKDFSKKFNASNMSVAKTLCTKASRSRYAKQKDCFNGLDFDSLKMNILLKERNFDINFTDNITGEIESYLMKYTRYYDGTNREKINWLIDNGADLSEVAIMPHNIKVLMINAIHSLDTINLSKVFDHPCFNVNISDCRGNTLLHLLIESVEYECMHWRDLANQRYEVTSKIINMLLLKGIDYSKANILRYTPLDIVKNHDLHILLEKALSNH